MRGFVQFLSYDRHYISVSIKGLEIVRIQLVIYFLLIIIANDLHNMEKNKDLLCRPLRVGNKPGLNVKSKPMSR